jgi:hypothetical protein
MSDEAILLDRGRIDADVDAPDARPAAPGHAEWMIDESIEETVPASDPTSSVRPGSLASQGSTDAPQPIQRATVRQVMEVFLGAAAIGFIAGLVLGTRGALHRLH